GGGRVVDRVREAVGRELGAHVPRADARRLAVAPHPAAVEVARLRADADAAEVRVVADVDREPAPHARPAPAPRPPRLVAAVVGSRNPLVFPRHRRLLLPNSPILLPLAQEAACL